MSSLPVWLRVDPVDLFVFWNDAEDGTHDDCPRYVSETEHDEIVARLTRERDDARTVLHRNQYRENASGLALICWGCGGTIDEGCTPGCEIARALGEPKEGRA